MKLVKKELDINKVILINNVIFIKGKEKCNVDGVFVSSDFELFNDLETVYRYKESFLDIYNYKQKSFVRISNDSNYLKQSYYNKGRGLVFLSSTEEVEVYNFFGNTIEYRLFLEKDISFFLENSIIVTEGKSYTYKNKISLWYIQPLELIWQYTLPEGFTIFKQPQIVDDVLFFDSFKNGNEENFVVGLDIKTGKVLWQLLFKIPYKEQLLATTLHKENKLCYGYLGNLYQIFNPISGKIVFEKEMNENINPYTNAIYDNKLWFVSGKYEECKFGYINLANNELELLQDFSQEDDETFEIVYHQKKLYLRGKYYNNLYIFEE